MTTKLFFIFGILGLLIFIGSLCFTSAIWTKDFFKNVGIEEILYTLSQPLNGTDKGQIYSFLRAPLLSSLIITFSALVILGILQIFITLKQHHSASLGKKGIILNALLSVIILYSGVMLGISKMGYADIKAYFFEKSTLYENYFVDPTDVQIKFPEKKRNLIYIYVESLETTYLSKEFGGAQANNLLPNLSQIALNNGINFSNTDVLGGAKQVPGVGFTVGGMVAQSAGVPLKVTGGYNENEYGDTSSFMPGLTTLGTILQNENYKQTLLIGSDANFGGRSKYYTQHGNYEIKDYNYAKTNHLIPNDYHVWWGYEDEKLFQFAKETLLQNAAGDQPFNLTLLTADTHFPNGYMGAATPKLYENQYSNVIHYSDFLISNFINWVQQQPFYENTTIILAGDHLSMDPTFFNDLTKDYERTVFNLIINSPIVPTKKTNREFTTMDLFPTTLSALGADIEGDRLGLGTNLFSSKETLPEEIGLQNFSDELSKGSNFYNKNIMQGSDLEANKN